MSKFTLVIPVYNDVLKRKEWGNLCRSWEKYCKKNDINLVYLEGSGKNVAEIYFDRWQEFNPPPDCERVTFVDADTYIREDAPNFFKIFEKENYKIVAVPDQGGSGVYHLNQWKGFNPNWDIMSLIYFNAGFISFPKDLFISFSNKIGKYKEYYFKNKDKDFYPVGIGIENGIRMDAGDQTGVNICIQKEIGELTLLNPIFNYMVGCHHPEVNPDRRIHNNQNKKQLDNIDFIQKAYMFHFGSPCISRTNISQLLNNLKY